MNTDRFLTIPADEYHAASRSGQYMSSHLLADFRESPELYRRKTSGEIASADTQSLALGRAAHCLILEGRAAFDEQFLVADGPVNPKTNEPYGKATKAYADWQASQTKEIVSQKDFGFILKLQKSVWTHPTASALLDNGASEATVRASYCDVPCQQRREIGHGYLELLRFYLNHRIVDRSRVREREGKSPHELLTGKRHAHWLDMLGFALKAA